MLFLLLLQWVGPRSMAQAPPREAFRGVVPPMATFMDRLSLDGPGESAGAGTRRDLTPIVTHMNRSSLDGPCASPDEFLVGLLPLADPRGHRQGNAPGTI